MKIRSTTIVAVKRDGKVAIAGDGQVTLQTTVMKHTAKKIRRLYQGKVLAGFAGSVADAQTLADSFERKLEGSSGNLTRAAIEFAKDWRTDRILRRLEAMMIVSDGERILILSGDGNVVEPDDEVAAIGSGGSFALAAAKALLRNSELDARSIVEEAMRIAGEICIYTNSHVTIETLPQHLMAHLDLPDASLDYIDSFFYRNEADLLFAQLLDEINWRSEKIVMYGKEMEMPRLSSWVGDHGARYTYSRRTFVPSPWTPTLTIIRSRLEKHLGTEFNSCLCNLYRTGQDSMGWHSDDEPELGIDPTIASISLGEPRRFKLRHRRYRSLKHDIVLGPGSLLVMSGDTQANWQHSLPKSAQVLGSRVNLTFRLIEVN